MPATWTGPRSRVSDAALIERHGLDQRVELDPFGDAELLAGTPSDACRDQRAADPELRLDDRAALFRYRNDRAAQHVENAERLGPARRERDVARPDPRADALPRAGLHARNDELAAIEPERGQMIGIVVRNDVRVDQRAGFVASRRRAKVESSHDL